MKRCVREHTLRQVALGDISRGSRQETASLEVQHDASSQFDGRLGELNTGRVLSYDSFHKTATSCFDRQNVV